MCLICEKMRTFKLVNSKLHRNHIKHTVLRLCVYFRPNKGVIITDNTYHNIRTFVESNTSFISRKKDFLMGYILYRINDFPIQEGKLF